MAFSSSDPVRFGRIEIRRTGHYFLEQQIAKLTTAAMENHHGQANTTGVPNHCSDKVGNVNEQPMIG